MQRRRKINMQEYTLKQIEEKRIEELKEKRYSCKLNASLSIPSITNSYSLGCGYIKKWFFDKIKEKYFKYWTINEASYNKAFKRAEIAKNLKIQKPSLLITPAIDFDWDRDGLDHNLLGVTNYLRNHGQKNSFLQDTESNVFLSMELTQIRIAFNFKIRVETRSQQIDLCKAINLKCRIGATTGENIDMDFHIPDDIMIQLAKDKRFKIKNNKITNIQEFMKYLNSHSRIPIIYKFRKITGTYEFFMRVKGLYTHIDMREKLSPDDGEQVEQIRSNYNVEARFILDLICPKYYAYYSENKHEINYESSYDYTFPIGVIKLPDIPDINNKGWSKFYTVDIEEETLHEPLYLEFEELFTDNSEDIIAIKKIIDHNIDSYITPSNFIDIKLFNNGYELHYDIDWKEFKLQTKENITSHITNMILYVDREYLNNYKIILEDLNNSSMSTPYDKK